MVTHSIQAASYAGRVLFIKDGCVYHQIYRGNQSKDAMYKMISDALTVLQSEGNTGAQAEREAGAPVGSSARIMSGSVIMALQAAARCFCPPDTS